MLKKSLKVIQISKMTCEFFLASIFRIDWTSSIPGHALEIIDDGWLGERQQQAGGKTHVVKVGVHGHHNWWQMVLVSWLFFAGSVFVAKFYSDC